MDYSSPSSSSPSSSSGSSPDSPTSSVQPSFPPTPTTPGPPPVNPTSPTTRSRLGLGGKGNVSGLTPARRVMTSALMNAKLSLVNSSSISRRLSLPADHGDQVSSSVGCEPQSVVTVRLPEHQEEDGTGDESYELYGTNPYPSRVYRDSYPSLQGSTRLVPPSPTADRNHQTPSSPIQKSSSNSPFAKLRRSVSAAVRGPSALSIPTIPSVPPSPSRLQIPNSPKSPRKPSSPSSPRIPSSPAQHTADHNQYRLSQVEAQYHQQQQQQTYQTQYTEARYNGPPTRYYHRPQRNESRCMQRIKEDLYIAFEDDDVSFGIPSHPPPSCFSFRSPSSSSSSSSPSSSKSLRRPSPRSLKSLTEEEDLRTSNNQRFTHVIRVSALKLVPGQPLPPPEIRFESNTIHDAFTGTRKDHTTKRLCLTVHPYYHSSYEYRMNLLSMEPELEAICQQQQQQQQARGVGPTEAGTIPKGSTKFPFLEGLTPEQARMYYEASAQEMDDSDDGMTRLTMKQLCAARDFLAGSGYDVTRDSMRNGTRKNDGGSSSGHVANPRNERGGGGGGPRILITAPRDHRTDVISILVCFLAYVSNNPATELLSRIDKQKEFLSVWRGVGFFRVTYSSTWTEDWKMFYSY
ncbi:hypothetical protein K435DRAFT_844037 [Dendrothele bispora CBS 962.96]|uniref:Uncharacterized protein n=1 Tax=Dendrothele bispora (strain CBS 962.96) TaxID=1314807 RepID=A0A4S8L4J3_DENBC|nr:hypothetical protein K435DRAFT_844037 [Dendrothele bispora CBS 962.96]